MNPRQSQQNGQSPQTLACLTGTVREFFGTMAWTGEPIQASSAGTTVNAQLTELKALDMGGKVRDFFNQFLWDGPLMIAAQVPLVEASTTSLNLEDELTLDGFADLF